jgi:hypothetical protein
MKPFIKRYCQKDDQDKKAEGKNSEEEEEKGRLCGSIGTIANVGGAF